MKKLIFLLLITNIFAVNILILNSYSPTLKWTDIQSRTLINLLKNKIENLDLYVEFMNTKAFRPTPQRNENYLCYLEKKYNNIKFDIVITTDDNALNFVRHYKNKPIFKNAKVFFEGVNNLSLKDKLDKNYFTGIFEKKEPLSNLEMAKKVKPNLKTIYVISDASTSGSKTIKQYQKAFSKIKNINFVYINNEQIDTILQKIKNYDKNSVMMAITFASIKKGNKFIPPYKAIQIISKYYKNPIIIHTNTYADVTNTNIIGGNCTDAKQQATLNSKKVIDYIINKKDIKDINFTLKGANKLYLNVKNLEKFGLHIDDFPVQDAVLVNKPSSFYAIYKTQIYTFIFIFAVILFFLILLTAKNREIIKLNKDLQIKIKKAIEENRKKEQLLFQQSKLAAMGEMIGAIAHQWRQPLNSLALNIQILVDDYLDGHISEEYLYNFEKKQMETINFMSKTIDDFRNFFSQDKEKVEFYLKDPVLEVLNLLDKQFLDHHIKITLDYDDSKIIGYKNEFKQVILNILNNAKDALIENNIKNKEIHISIKNNKVIITDNAGGIPDKIKDRIFEPYFTTKEQGKGTGIGLYMSKIIIEEHMKGKLFFKNIDNKTQFIIQCKDEK